jgi:hypothetical protein
MGHLLWQMTRATRQIGSAMDATPLLKEVFEGKKNTRELQKEFGEKLAQAGIKTSGMTRADSGGNRTWMTLPKIFGLCYEDKDKIVRFTPVGIVVAKGGKQSMLMMEKQLLTFQYPNRTQEHFSQIMDDKFCIFPYRFLVKLLLKVKYLTVQEIEYFVLPVSSDKELVSVSKNIELFRKGKIKLDYESHRKKYKKDHDQKLYKKYINDLANTFKNHMEFLRNISSKRIGMTDQLFIEPKYEKKWAELIEYLDAEWKFNDTYTGQDRKFFVDRYGRLPGIKKASSKTSKPVTKDQTKIRKIQNAIVEIMGESPSQIERDKMIERIHELTYISNTKIDSILSKYPEFIKTNYNAFEKKYLLVGGDGDRWQEFEKMTNDIFKKMGFTVGYQKRVKLSSTQKGFLDGYVTLGSESGLIDSKAGKGFSCGNKEVGVMKDYIREAKKFSDDKQFKFFGYVYGRIFSNHQGFERISAETGIKGFRISAVNLLHCMNAVQDNKVSKEQIWEQFQKNDEITSFD